MALKCDKCNLEFSNKEVSAVCVECKKSFHAACTRIGSVQLTKNRVKSWKCDSCKGESNSVASGHGDDTEDRKSILEAVQSMNINLDCKLGVVQSSIMDLTKEVRQISEKIKNLEENHASLQLAHEKLQHNHTELSGMVIQMQERLLDMEQHSRCANIEIQGIPPTPNEDIYRILERVAHAIGLEFHRADISIAHRLRKFSQKLSYPPIIVQFVSRTDKEGWMDAAKKKKGLKSTELAASLTPSTIYLNDHLTPNNKALLGRARRLFKERKLHFAGYFNGKVLIKHREGDQSVRVSHIDDLNRFEKEAFPAS